MKYLRTILSIIICSLFFVIGFEANANDYDISGRTTKKDKIHLKPLVILDPAFDENAMLLVYASALDPFYLRADEHPQLDSIQEIPQKQNASKNILSNAIPVETTEFIDRELAQALNFYYNEKFDKAFSIFEKLYKQTENTDMLFWMGTSASKNRKYSLAIEKLKQVLAIYPGAYRVRLELAKAYFQNREYEHAKYELQRIKADAPPEEIWQIVNHYLSIVEQRSQRLSWNTRLSLGYQYDNNVSCGPAKSEIEDMNIGNSILLDDRYRKISTSKLISDVRTDFLYDVGALGAFHLNSGFKFFHSRNFRDSDFNYMDADIFTGPWWIGKEKIFKMPIGFIHKEYGNTELSNTFYTHPHFELFLKNYLSIKGGYLFSVENYENESYSERGYDNVNCIFSFGSSLYLSEYRHILSALFSYEDHQADASEQSYEARHFTLSYFKKFPTLTELLLSYKWTDKKYDAPLAYYNDMRHDIRNTLIAMLIQRFLKDYFISFEVGYIDNYSNLDLYDFDKFILTLSTGIYF